MYKIGLIILILILAFSMGLRYEKIKYDNIEKGVTFDQQTNGLVSISALDITNDKKPSIFPSFTDETFSNEQSNFALTCIHGPYQYYALVKNVAGTPTLRLYYRGAGTSAWTLKYTEVLGDWDALNLYSHNDVLYLYVLWNGVEEYKKSTDDGATWVDSHDAAGYLNTQKNPNNGYYYATKHHTYVGRSTTLSIARSLDRITWTEIAAPTGVTYYVKKILFLDDEIYFYMQKGLSIGDNVANNAHRLVRFNARTNELETIREFSSGIGGYNLSATVFEKYIVLFQILDDSIRMHRFDGYNWISTSLPLPSGLSVWSANFNSFAEVRNRLYTSIDGKLAFITNDFSYYPNAYDIFAGQGYDADLNFSVSLHEYDGLLTIQYTTDSGTDTTGGIETLNTGSAQSMATLIFTTIYESIVAKQILLRHSPITTGGSIKIYYSLNGGTSYTLFGTANTVGSMAERFTFANNIATEGIIFKVEILKNTANKNPAENIDMTFFYIPKGLEYAK